MKYLTTRSNEASRGLSTIAELLVIISIIQAFITRAHSATILNRSRRGVVLLPHFINVMHLHIHMNTIAIIEEHARQSGQTS